MEDGAVVELHERGKKKAAPAAISPLLFRPEKRGGRGEKEKQTPLFLSLRISETKKGEVTCATRIAGVLFDEKEGKKQGGRGGAAQRVRAGTNRWWRHSFSSYTGKEIGGGTAHTP